MNASPTVLAYTVNDACTALGVGRTRLYGLIAEEQIEARQCGGRTLIPAESLREFLANLPPAPIRKKAADDTASM
jgi:excisionase family DNA binding protein